MFTKVIKMQSLKAWLMKDQLVSLKDGGSASALRWDAFIKVDNVSWEQISKNTLNHYLIPAVVEHSQS